MFKSVAAVGGLTFVSRILGYIRDVFIGSIFGDSGISDVFFQAFRLPNIFRSLFAEGALNSAFVPIFSKIYKREGKESALSFVHTIFTFLFIFLFILICIFEIGMPTIMGILSPGFQLKAEKFRLAIDFGHIVFPYILFISLAALCAGVLNSLNQFAAAAAAPILLNLFCIIALWGFGQYQEKAGYALCWATVFAGVAQLGWVMLMCRYIQMPLKLTSIRFSEEVKNLLKKMGPGIASSGVYQINLVISSLIASYVPLAVSYLAFADRINQFPLSIIGVAIGTVLLPVLTRYLTSEKYEKALHMQNRVLQLSCVVTFPAATALYIISLPIVVTLFQHGKFTPYMSQEVAKILSIYSLCLPANVMVKIFSASFFARGDTKKPMKAAVFSILTNLLGTLILFSYLSYYGIAWAAVLSSWVNNVTLVWWLHRKKFFIIDAELKKRLPRIMVSAIFMGFVLVYVRDKILCYLGQSLFLDGFLLLSLIGVGFTTYLFVVIKFKGFIYKDFRQEFSSSPGGEQLIEEMTEENQ